MGLDMFADLGGRHGGTGTTNVTSCVTPCVVVSTRRPNGQVAVINGPDLNRMGALVVNIEGGSSRIGDKRI